MRRWTSYVFALAMGICGRHRPPEAGGYAGAVLYPLTAPNGDQSQQFTSGLPTFAGQTFGLSFGSTRGDNAHAFLWSGPNGSVVDLNPTNLTGFTESDAYATNGTQQVGFGDGSATGNNDDALLWSGTANSAIDLQLLLPAAGTWTSSYADSIDAEGDVYGTAQAP